MSILKELLGLTEAHVSVELKDVIAAFPKHHAKALQQLWGGQRLVWHGMKFFEDDELGPAHVKAEQAAEEYIANGYSADVNMDIGGTIDGEEYDDSMRWDVEFDKDEKQECYLGYDPQTDKLYIGFDAWVSEDEFNSAFDKAFEEMTGEEHNLDNEEHQKVFNAAWEEFKNENYGFWGLIFEISFDGENMEAEEAYPALPGGFYKGVFPSFKRQQPRVIDLRLD